jgi:hypothetical protein
MPGTALVMGVRFGGLGEITPRSVTGVHAPAGNPAIVLFGGVVTALAVVRSALSKQIGSAIGNALRRSR